jgi:hypothetical protein
MAVRLPFYNVDAFNTFKELLGKKFALTERAYGVSLAQHGDVKKCEITCESNEEEEIYTNMILYLEYYKYETKGERISSVGNELNLRLLSGLGDRDWGYRSIIKVWDGDYPSTVGVDIKTGKVYFVYIREGRLDIVYFGSMSEEELDTFEETFNDREPFKVGIVEDALYDYLDEAEGYNYLKKNVYIEFNCCNIIKVTQDN